MLHLRHCIGLGLVSWLCSLSVQAGFNVVVHNSGVGACTVHWGYNWSAGGSCPGGNEGNLGELAPGQSSSPGYFPEGCYVWVNYWGGGYSGCGFQAALTSDIVVNVWGGQTPPQPDWRLNVGIHNGSTVDRYYRLVNADTGAYIDGGMMVIPPGTDAGYTYVGPGKINVGVVPYYYDPQTGAMGPVGTGGTVIPATDGHWSQSETPPYFTGYSDHPNVGSTPAPGGPGSDGWFNIGWGTPGAAPATDDTLKQVGDVLYTSLTEGLNAINRNSQAATAAANRAASAMEGASGALTASNAKLDDIDSVLRAFKEQEAAGNTAKVNAINSANTATVAKLDWLGGRVDAAGSQAHTDAGVAHADAGTAHSDAQAIKDKIQTETQRILDQDTTQRNNLASILNANGTAAHADAQTIWNRIEGVTSGITGLGTQLAGNISDGANTVGAKVDAAKTQAHSDVDRIVDAINADKNTNDQHKNQAHQDILDDRALQHTDLDAINRSIGDFKTEAHTDQQALQAGMGTATNILAGVGKDVEAIRKNMTNGPAAPDTGAQQAAGTAAGNTLKGQFDTLAGGVGTPAPMAGGIGGNPWVITFGFAPWTWSVNCNPLTYPDVVTLAAWIKGIIVVLINCTFAFLVFRVFEEYFKAGTLLPQAHAAGTSLAGTNLNTGVALVVAGLIVAVLSAMVLWFANYWSAHIGTGLFGANPLDGGATIGGMVRYVLAAFVPVDLILSTAASYLTLKWSAGGVYALAAASTRFLVG